MRLLVTGGTGVLGRAFLPLAEAEGHQVSAPGRAELDLFDPAAVGARMRGVVKGKRWLLLTRWVHLTADKRQQLNHLFALNRRLMKAYLLKESLERLWTYTYEGAMQRYLKSWTLQLRWQRLPAFGKLAHMLIDHLDGILNYCRVKVRFGVVEAINGNIKALLRRGRGYKNLRYLLLKAQRMAVTKTEFVVFRKAA